MKKDTYNFSEILENYLWRISFWEKLYFLGQLLSDNRRMKSIRMKKKYSNEIYTSESIHMKEKYTNEKHTNEKYATKKYTNEKYVTKKNKWIESMQMKRIWTKCILMTSMSIRMTSMSMKGIQLEVYTKKKIYEWKAY